MTAEEFLIEKFKELEKKVADAEEAIEDLHELISDKKEELEEYIEVVDVLQRHFSKSASGVHFDFFKASTSFEEMELLRNFFDFDDADEE